MSRRSRALVSLGQVDGDTVAEQQFDITDSGLETVLTQLLDVFEH